MKKLITSILIFLHLRKSYTVEDHLNDLKTKATNNISDLDGCINSLKNLKTPTEKSVEVEKIENYIDNISKIRDIYKKWLDFEIKLAEALSERFLKEQYYAE